MDWDEEKSLKIRGLYGLSCIRSWIPRQTRERPGELNVHSFITLKGGEKEGKIRKVERVKKKKKVKMAPRMAAMLQSITVYDRDTLLNIGSYVAQRKPDFEFLNAGGLFTDTASEPFVWVAKSRRRRRRRKRGKRAGVLVRLRRRAFRPPLPTILLANIQSLDNKLCELRARISYQRETRDCCVICLTETWMSAIVPDSAIELTGFSVHRSDRTKELTGKSRGGGVCF